MSFAYFACPVECAPKATEDYAMAALKKLKKRRRNKARMTARAPRKNSKTHSQLPPNENLRKFPDETYGDMQLPFARS